MTNKEQILATALRNLEIKELNPMQEATLRKATSPNDLILLSPTGSGKTLAFLLPLLQILRPNDSSIQALILVPSRELALQTASVFQAMKSPWQICCCYGGHPIGEEKRSIAGTKPAVVIGTPGRVCDHIYKGNFDTSKIKTLVIDEFDKSLEFGFHDEMWDIITQLPALSKRILLSATDAEEIPEFTGLNQTTTLNFLKDKAELKSRLEMRRVISPARDKIETLYRLLCSLGSNSSIVFCNHREAADRIKSLLAERGLYGESFHGGMEQPDRERALYKFRNGSCHVFIATDLAARGLDIPEVEHIIHYHLPTQQDAFTHRNGRTARWESTGVAYLILCEDELPPRFLDDVDRIEELTLPETTPPVPRPIWTTLYIGKGRKDKLSKMDVAGFLHKKGGLSRDEVGRIEIKDHYGFVTVRRDKLRSMMSLIRGEKIKGRSILIEEAR
ncbi:MAG: DEAD/DEAH box helicase [Rikenellaceae bacterium]